jgi:hypothetical protein
VSTYFVKNHSDSAKTDIIKMRGFATLAGVFFNRQPTFLWVLTATSLIRCFFRMISFLLLLKVESSVFVLTYSELLLI